MAERKEWLCEGCDWIGSPPHEIGECLNCGSPNIVETGMDAGDDGLE